MKLFLGIDGGGTHTHAILVDRTGCVRGQGQAGPANYHNIRLPAATANLRAATEAAWRAAGGQPSPAAYAFIGCAGVKAAVDVARVTAAAESAKLAAPGAVTVANDLYNALTGGLADAPGIALIAGTGTNCLGRDATGTTFMCGGWGWLLDDEGGGCGLALTALRRAVRSADGRSPKTGLLPAALAFYGLSEPDEILASLYGQSKSPEELAALTPIVCRLAVEGDAGARQVLGAGAQALAALVRGVAAKLKFARRYDVVLLGGCATSGEPYQPLVETAIRKACPGARLVKPRYTPIEGAALNVLRMAGVDPLPALRYPNVGG